MIEDEIQKAKLLVETLWYKVPDSAVRFAKIYGDILLASGDVISVKELREKIERLIVHKTWYCEDCDETIFSTYDHNADHTIDGPSEFVDKKALLAILELPKSQSEKEVKSE